VIRFRLGSHDGVTLSVQAKEPGAANVTKGIDLGVDFEQVLGERQQPYERLLGDAIVGDARRFSRVDMVEQEWRIVDPGLDGSTPVFRYPRGSFGPREADALLGGDDHWHDPLT
jgi:glucose-6-phosphate 1-dehydrogenase